MRGRSMVNIRELGVLLDTLQSGDESQLAATPVARVAAAARVSRDETQSHPSIAADEVLPAASVPRSTVARALNDNLPRGASDLARNQSASLALSATAQWM